MHAVSQSKPLNEEPEIHCCLWGGNVFLWGSVIDFPGFCLYDQVKEFISEFGVLGTKVLL